MSWLWPGRIPFGAVTVRDGDPGLGKSRVAESVARLAACGAAFPGSNETRQPVGVVLLNAEDPAGLIQANFRAGGPAAQTANVPVLDRDACRGKPVRFPDDLEAVAGHMEEIGARLLVLDPFPAFVSGSVTNESSVRRLMPPLAEFAERLGAAVLPVRHLTKAGGGGALDRGSGGIGVIGAARSGLVVTRDPANPGQSLLAHDKSNDGPLQANLGFQIDGQRGGRSVRWGGPAPHSAGEALELSLPAGETSLAEAARVLFAILSDGPVLTREVKRIVLDNGVAARTLTRAKAVPGPRSRRRGFGRGSRVFWGLPDPGQVGLADRLRRDEADDRVEEARRSAEESFDDIAAGHPPGVPAAPESATPVPEALPASNDGQVEAIRRRGRLYRNLDFTQIDFGDAADGASPSRTFEFSDFGEDRDPA